MTNKTRMTRKGRALDRLKRAFEGAPWHGPSLFEILARFDGKAAAWRPLPSVHDAREIAHHLATWFDIPRRRLLGESVSREEEARVDWPPADGEPEPWPEPWESVAVRLRVAALAFLMTVEQLEESDLERTVIDRSYDVEDLLDGVVQHLAYHGGQLALLERLARAAERAEAAGSRRAAERASALALP